MSQPLDFPTCYVCRSIELELVRNEEFGPMTLCAECGYSWIATYEDISSSAIETKASQPRALSATRGGSHLHVRALISDASKRPSPKDDEVDDITLIDISLDERSSHFKGFGNAANCQNEGRAS